MTQLEKAEQAIRDGRATVDAAYLPKFHLHPPVGWINDPNGFCRFKGKYHLFAQFHPYDSVWGPMHYYHWISDDLVYWEEVGVTMAPDRPFDDWGCFSGTALEHEGKLYLMYTGVHGDAEGRMVQEQCIAVSEDGICFTKYEGNPVISIAQLPEGFAQEDFRDPKLSRTADGFRAIMAARKGDKGYHLSYSSKDLLHWTYDGVFLDGLGRMVECPDYEICADKDMMVTCVMHPVEPMRYRGDYNTVAYVYGTERDGKLCVEGAGNVDCGPDFYAPESIITSDGRRVLIAWAHLCGTNSPTHGLHHKWCCQMSVPSEIWLKDGVLYKYPIRELQALRGECVAESDIRVNGKRAWENAKGQCYDMELSLGEIQGEAKIRLMEGVDEALVLTLGNGEISMDRGSFANKVEPEGAPEWEIAPVDTAKAKLEAKGDVRLRILVDHSIVEVFVNDGELSMTMRAYPKRGSEGISFEGDFVIRELKQWDMKPILR